MLLTIFLLEFCFNFLQQQHKLFGDHDVTKTDQSQNDLKIVFFRAVRLVPTYLFFDQLTLNFVSYSIFQIKMLPNVTIECLSQGTTHK